MIGSTALLDAGFSNEEAYRAMRQRMSPAVLASLRTLRMQAPQLFICYEAQWRKAGLAPPWDGLLDDPNHGDSGSSHDATTL